MPATSAAATSATSAPSEIVLRPSGLRHGRWEAPEWMFWTSGAVVVVLAVLYALFRLGYLRKKPA